MRNNHERSTELPPEPGPSSSIAFGPAGTLRGGVAVVVLSILTLGLYWLVYVYKTHNELKEFCGRGIGGGTAAVVAVCCLGIATPFLLGREVRNARARLGLPLTVSAATGFWALIPVAGAFMFVTRLQNALNELWVAARPNPAARLRA